MLPQMKARRDLIFHVLEKKTTETDSHHSAQCMREAEKDNKKREVAKCRQMF